MFPPVWIPSLYVSQFYKLNSDGKKKLGYMHYIEV